MTPSGRLPSIDTAVDAEPALAEEDEAMNSGVFGDTLGGVRAVDLLHQQIWCWGKDVTYPEGNLLVRHGFERIEKPPGSDVASLYRLDVSPTARVVLRGFGLFYGDDRWGGLFLRRYTFSPRLTPAADLAEPAWRADDLPKLSDPGDGDLARCRRLLRETVDWIHRYEVWIAESVGLAHRRRMLASWSPKEYVVTPAEEVSGAWRTIGEALTNEPARRTEPRDAA